MDFLSFMSDPARAAVALILGLVGLALLFMAVVWGTVGLVTFFNAAGARLARWGSKILNFIRRDSKNDGPAGTA